MFSFQAFSVFGYCHTACAWSRAPVHFKWISMRIILKEKANKIERQKIVISCYFQPPFQGFVPSTDSSCPHVFFFTQMITACSVADNMMPNTDDFWRRKGMASPFTSGFLKLKRNTMCWQEEIGLIPFLTFHPGQGNHPAVRKKAYGFSIFEYVFMAVLMCVALFKTLDWAAYLFSRPLLPCSSYNTCCWVHKSATGSVASCKR